MPATKNIKPYLTYGKLIEVIQNFRQKSFEQKSSYGGHSIEDIKKEISHQLGINSLDLTRACIYVDEGFQKLLTTDLTKYNDRVNKIIIYSLKDFRDRVAELSDKDKLDLLSHITPSTRNKIFGPSHLDYIKGVQPINETSENSVNWHEELARILFPEDVRKTIDLRNIGNKDEIIILNPGVPVSNSSLTVNKKQKLDTAIQNNRDGKEPIDAQLISTAGKAEQSLSSYPIVSPAQTNLTYFKLPDNDYLPKGIRKRAKYQDLIVLENLEDALKEFVKGRNLEFLVNVFINTWDALKINQDEERMEIISGIVVKLLNIPNNFIDNLHNKIISALTLYKPEEHFNPLVWNVAVFHNLKQGLTYEDSQYWAKKVDEALGDLSKTEKILRTILDEQRQLMPNATAFYPGKFVF